MDPKRTSADEVPPEAQQLDDAQLEKVQGGGKSDFFDEADALFGKTKGIASGDRGNGI